MSKLAERILAFNHDLLPDMVQLKYEAMAENEFRFYRGTCHLFYEDLVQDQSFPDGPLTWISGDLHLENFGSYKAQNRLVYFDLNDFDESVLAPATWELARLVTSIFIAFDSLEIEREKAENMAHVYLKSYTSTLSKGKAFSIEPRTAKGIVKDFLNAAEKTKQSDLLKKRTVKKKRKVHLSLSDERHFKLTRPERRDLYEHIERWIEHNNDSPYNYKVKGAVFRVAGTGSLGLKRYLILLKSKIEKNDYLLVDMKQSRSSSLLPYLSNPQPQWESEADRIVIVQQRMQYISSSLLSTTNYKGEPYVIQELQPVKDTIKFKLIKDQYRDIYQVIDDMGLLTASSHLRSGGIHSSATIDELVDFAAAEGWQEQLIQYALKYADKVKRYYRQYLLDYERGVFNKEAQLKLA